MPHSDVPAAPAPADLTEARALVARHAAGRADGDPVATAIPRVVLIRANTSRAAFHTLVQPVLCAVLQGRKQSLHGDQRYDYGAGAYGVVPFEAPTTASISEVTPTQPFLGFGLRLDPLLLGAVLLEMRHANEAGDPEAGRTDPGSASRDMGVDPVTADLLAPMLRLLRLLDRPADIPVLAPLAERELLYRLLTGAQRGVVAQVARTNGPVSQVSWAIDWIRRHYARPLRVDELARTLGMSASSLYRHFKAATGLTPVAFHHQTRLQEARRLLLVADVDAARAGIAVGFASRAQFNREYKRQFGVSPRRDARQLREA